MEEGAVNLNQRRKLELLREYAEIAINEKSVTYEKWIQFNGMLAEALGRKSLKVSASLEELIKDFPTIILMPTTKGKVGFITISEGIDSNVYILGLSNKQEIKYDGVTGDSLDLFNHDLFHIKRTLDAKTRINHNFYRKMREVRKQIKNLPSEKRKSMELIIGF